MKNIACDATSSKLLSGELEQVTFYRERRKFAMYSFMVVGVSPERKQQDRPIGVDFVGALLELNNSARELLLKLIENRDRETNITVVDSREISPGKKTVFSRGYKVLEKKRLVLRTKPHHYWINPLMIATFPMHNMPKQVEDWEKLVKQYEEKGK